MAELVVTDVTIRDYTQEPSPIWRADLTYQEFRYALREHAKSRNQQMRVYVSVNDENILENFANRTSRPWQAWKPLVEAALKARGFKYDKIRWSQKAGCTLCPCSPGFIIEGARHGIDVWLTVVADKPQRTDDDEATNRAAQLVHRTVELDAVIAAAAAAAPERTFTMADFDTEETR